MIAIYNTMILLFVVLGGALGYKKGFHKNISQLIFSCMLFIIGCFLSPIMGKLIMKIDLSLFNITFNNIKFTNLNDFLIKIIINKVPLLNYTINPQTISYQFIYNISYGISKVIFMIIWIILIITIFKMIFNLYYKKRIEIKDKSKKQKYGGMVIGIIKSFGLVFILSAFFSGISSLKHSTEIIQKTYQENLSYIKPTISSSNHKEYHIIDKYRLTSTGTIFEAIRIKKIPIDEHMFDMIFSFKHLGKRINIRQDLEIFAQVYFDFSHSIDGEVTIEKVFTMNEESINCIFRELNKSKSISYYIPIIFEIMIENKLFCDKEDVFDKVLTYNYDYDMYHFEQFFRKAYELEIIPLKTDINFYLNLNATHIRIMLYHLGNIQSFNIIGDLFIGNLERNQKVLLFFEDNNIEMPDLDNINWCDEAKNLGIIFEQFKKLGIFSTDFSKIDFSKMNDENLNALAIAVYNSNLLDKNSKIIMDIMISFLPDNYQDMIKVNQFEFNDFLMMLLFGKVLFECGLMKENINASDLLRPENVELIAGYISSSHLLSENIKAILYVFLQGFNFPKDFILDVPPSVNWYGYEGKKEISNLFNKINELNIQLSNEQELVTNLETLSFIIYDSKILVYNINNILKFLNNRYISESFQLFIDDFDWESDEGRYELQAFVKAVGLLIKSNLFYSPIVSNLSDDEILILAHALSSSKIIKQNLSSMITIIMLKIRLDYQIKVFDDYEMWTESEISSLLKAMKTIEKLPKIPDDLFLLSLDEINEMLDSRLITETLKDEIIKLSYKTSDFNIIINYEEDDPRWYDNGEDDGEIKKLFKALNIIFAGSSSFPDIDPNILFSLTDGTVDTNGDNIIDEEDKDEIKEILNSQIISDSFIKYIYEFGKQKPNGEPGDLVVRLELNDINWYGENGELRRFIQAVKIILADSKNITNVNINPNILKSISTGQVNEENDDLSIILRSDIATETIIRRIKGLERIELSNNTNFVIDIEDEDWRDSPSGKPGELRNLIRAIQIIFGPDDDLNNPEINPTFILELSDGSKDTNGDGVVDGNDSNDLGKILKSKIISDSIIRVMIEKMKNST